MNSITLSFSLSLPFSLLLSLPLLPAVNDPPRSPPPPPPIPPISPPITPPESEKESENIFCYDSKRRRGDEETRRCVCRGVCVLALFVLRHYTEVKAAHPHPPSVSPSVSLSASLSTSPLYTPVHPHSPPFTPVHSPKSVSLDLPQTPRLHQMGFLPYSSPSPPHPYSLQK